MPLTMQRPSKSPPTVRPANAAAPVETNFAQSPLGQMLRQGIAGGAGVERHHCRLPVAQPGSGHRLGYRRNSAAHTGTSTATLSRFARTVGFGGFAALRAGMADALQATMPPVYQPVEKLKDALGRAGSAAPAEHPVIAESLEVSLVNLRATAAGLESRHLVAIAQRIWRHIRLQYPDSA